MIGAAAIYKPKKIYCNLIQMKLKFLLANLIKKD